MARTTTHQGELDVIGDMADRLADKLISLENETNGILREEITAIRRYAEIIQHKMPRLKKLSRFAEGYMFAIIDSNGEIRQATKDEARRVIMGYPTKGVNVIEAVRYVNEQLYTEFNQRIGEAYQRYLMSEHPAINSRPAASINNAEADTEEHIDEPHGQ